MKKWVIQIKAKPLINIRTKYSFLKRIYEMLFNNIKWLFFDLGYTLINEDEAHIKRINDCIE